MKFSVGQAEWNYILKPHWAGRVDRWGVVYDGNWNVSVHDNLKNALKNNPSFALSAAWHEKWERSGLSPFVMHYLSQDKRSIEDYIAYIRRMNYRLWKYTYCHTTRLPVVNTYARLRWDESHAYDMLAPSERREHTSRPRNFNNLPRWQREDIEAELRRVARNNLRRDEAEARLIPDYKWIIAHSRDVDNDMRSFGGRYTTISKETWQQLKGVADIYL